MSQENDGVRMPMTYISWIRRRRDTLLLRESVWLSLGGEVSGAVRSVYIWKKVCVKIVTNCCYPWIIPGSTMTTLWGNLYAGRPTGTGSAWSRTPKGPRRWHEPFWHMNRHRYLVRLNHWQVLSLNEGTCKIGLALLPQSHAIKMRPGSTSPTFYEFIIESLHEDSFRSNRRNGSWFCNYHDS